MTRIALRPSNIPVNVLCVHLKVRSVHHRHDGCVCYNPHSRTRRLETNCTASRVSTRVCSAGTPLTGVTSVLVHFSVAQHDTSVCLFGQWFFILSHLLSTSCWGFVLSLCTFQLLSIHSPVDPACSHSTILPPLQASQDHVPTPGGRVLV